MILEWILVVSFFTGYTFVVLINAFLIFKSKIKEKRFVKEFQKQGMRFKQPSPMERVGGWVRTVYNLFLPVWNFLVFVNLIIYREEFVEYIRREVLRRKVEEE